MILFVVAFLAMTASVEAQEPPSSYYARQMMGLRGGGNGYGYGIYDPALVPYIQQMMRLPDALIACKMNFASGKIMGDSCQPIVKEMGAIQAFLRNPEGYILGTVHVEKNKVHFRPIDDTNHRLGTGGAGALGALGGGAIGGSLDGRRGAAIGAVGGALLAGFAASRNSHKNCLTLEPSQAQQAGSASPSAMAPTESASVAMANASSAPRREDLDLEILNESNEKAAIYDGDAFVTTLGGGARYAVTAPKAAYRGIVKRFNERGEVELYELGRRAEGGTLVFTSTATRLPK